MIQKTGIIVGEVFDNSKLETLRQKLCHWLANDGHPFTSRVNNSSDHTQIIKDRKSIHIFFAHESTNWLEFLGAAKAARRTQLHLIIVCDDPNDRTDKKTIYDICCDFARQYDNNPKGSLVYTINVKGLDDETIRGRIWKAIAIADQGSTTLDHDYTDNNNERLTSNDQAIESTRKSGDVEKLEPDISQWSIRKIMGVMTPMQLYAVLAVVVSFIVFAVLATWWFAEKIDSSRLGEAKNTIQQLELTNQNWTLKTRLFELLFRHLEAKNLGDQRKIVEVEATLTEFISKNVSVDGSDIAEKGVRAGGLRLHPATSSRPPTIYCLYDGTTVEIPPEVVPTTSMPRP